MNVVYIEKEEELNRGTNS